MYVEFLTTGITEPSVAHRGLSAVTVMLPGWSGTGSGPGTPLYTQLRSMWMLVAAGVLWHAARVSTITTAIAEPPRPRRVRCRFIRSTFR